MADCQSLPRCPMPLEDGVGTIYRKHYCTADFTRCARYQVLSTVGGAHVPLWLKPNMNEEGEQIIIRVRQDTPAQG